MERGAALTRSRQQRRSAGAPAHEPPPSEESAIDDARGGGAASLSCVVCLAAPARVVLPVCGHAVLCSACLANMRARGQPCPLCRAPMPSMTFRRAPSSSTQFVRAPARLHVLLRRTSMRRRAASALTALGAFADHCHFQCVLAVEAGAMSAAAAEMRRRPLSLRALHAGSLVLLALAQLKCGNQTVYGTACGCAPESLLDACVDARAFAAAAHVLRALAPPARGAGSGPARGAGSGPARGAGSGPALAAACRMLMLSIERSLPAPGWRRQADALARSAVAVVRHYEDDVEAQDAALDLLDTLVQHGALFGECELVADVADAVVAVLEQEHVEIRTTFANAAFLLVRMLDSCAERVLGPDAHAAAVDAAADANLYQDVLEPELDRMSRCACAGCEDGLLQTTLPLLQAMCMSSPEALEDALDELVPMLARTLHNFEGSSQAVLAAVYALLACIITPPQAAAAADVADWREVCCYAALLALEGEVHAKALSHVHAACECWQPSVQSLDDNAAILTTVVHALSFLAACMDYQEEASALLLAWDSAASPMLQCAAQAVGVLCAAAGATGAPSLRCSLLARGLRAACAVASTALRLAPEHALATAPQIQGGAPASCLLRLLQCVLVSRRACACAECDAAQGAACAALTQLSIALMLFHPRGAAACSRRYSRATLAAAARDVAAACAEHPLKPALRREAPRALALLLVAAQQQPAC